MMKSFLRENRAPLLLTALSPCLFPAIFLLYGYPVGPFLYALLLYALIFAAVWTVRYVRFRKAHADRVALREPLTNGEAGLPEAGTLADADWMDTARCLCGKIRCLTDESARERQNAQDYYTLWVHQIKTPIAAMRMQLQQTDFSGREALEAELFRVEQYADMALQYIRLEQSGSDLNFRLQPLDGIIRGSIRKYAPLFIAKKLSLTYGGTGLTVLTDAKWLGFILEQLLSNAVKYTPSGGVRIDVTDDLRLTVSDTGIGIAPEDLPRIFEKGFTGRNGRADLKATGLGLYLCGAAAKKLNVTLTAESEPGRGARFTLDLGKEPVRMD